MKNKCEYKGLFYDKKDSSHKFYEGGAHFKYIELFNALKKLSKKKIFSKSKKEKVISSLSQRKINNYLNYNISKNKSKNKSTKNLLISGNKTPLNYLINYSKKKIINDINKSLSKSKNKNLNNTHYNNASNFDISHFLNLKIKKSNINDKENNSRLSNISKIKENKKYFENLNIKHQPKSRNSKDKRIINKTKQDNMSLINNNITEYNKKYNYFFLEQKIDKKDFNNKNYKKIINSQNNNNNYSDNFKITKITPRSRGSLNKNTVMLNIRKLKNKDLIQKTFYNINDNKSIKMIANSFIKKKKNNISLDNNSKNKYKLTANSTMAEDFNIKTKIKKNNCKNNISSKILKNSLNKKRNNMNMTLLTFNKTEKNIKFENNKIENNKNKNNNVIINKIARHINKYIVRVNGSKGQNNRNSIYFSYRNKYVLNDLSKK